MKERERFVLEHLRGEQSLAQLCRRYEISRPTGHKWIERYHEGGRGGLDDRSRAPRSHPNRVDEALEELIVQERLAYPGWGPNKLLARLRVTHPEVERWPAASTVGELLKRRGLVHGRRRRRRATPTPGPLCEGAEANDLWCADFKGWFMAIDGARCEPLTITDHHTRFLIHCSAPPASGFEHCKPLFEAAFVQYGLPRRIRTDNGAPFGSIGLLGLSRLAVWWMRLGIEPERIEPGHPEQNGRHERMHRTLKERVTPTADRPRDLRAARERLQAFREEYNEERPHEALDQRTPGSLYTASGREHFGTAAPIEIPDHAYARMVCSKGSIHWGNNRLFLSETLRGETVTLEWIGERTLRIKFMCLRLADFDTVSGEIRYADGRKGHRQNRAGRRPNMKTFRKKA